MKKRNLPVILCFYPLLIFWFLPSGGEHSANSGEFIGKVINFVVLFGGLTYILRKPLMKFLENRGKELGRKIEESEKMEKDWKKKLQEVEKRLEDISSEIKTLNQKARGRGEERKKEILQAARTEAERIKTFSKYQIDALSQQAIQEIRQYAADLAVTKAKENIIKKLTLKKHHNLVGQSIERIKEFHEKFYPG